MILDSSVVVALLLKENGHEALEERVRAADWIGIGSPTLVETEIVLTRRVDRHARPALVRFLEDQDVDAVAFLAEHWRAAGLAYLTYGKGRHPAALNFGDCMAYATARVEGEPLLALGDDFAQTDIEVA